MHERVKLSQHSLSLTRHYIESIAILRDSVTVELFYLQAKALVFKVSV